MEPREILSKNLVHFLGPEKNSPTQQACADKLKMTQSAISKIKTGSTQEPGYLTVMKLADYFGVSTDDLTRRDIEKLGPSPQSHPEKLDLSRLGVALTSVDLALADVELQGRLGLLDDALQFAYAETFQMSDPNNKGEQKWLDRIVAERLRGWDERTREARDTGKGQKKDRGASPPRQKAGRG